MTQLGSLSTPSLSSDPAWRDDVILATRDARRINRNSAVRDRELSVADRAAAAVRQANARDCLMILRDAGTPLTVAELTSRSGLSRPTVDAVLQDLIAAGPVRASEPSECTTPGRPARRFVADPTTTLVAGVDVGADTIRCTVTDAAGHVVARSRTVLDPDDGTDRLGLIAEVVHAARQEAQRGPDDRPEPRLATVAVAVPGIVDHDQRISQSTSYPDWNGVDVRAELSGRLGCEVVVENDLKLAAYAEHHVAATAENLIFVQLGRRISVALMIGGQILQGSHRMAGEIGAQRGMRWTSSYDHNGLLWSTGREAKPLFDRAATGDHDALAEIDEFCAQVAPRLATLVLTLDPEMVIIGGGLSLSGELLLGPLRRHLDHLLTTPARPSVESASLRTDGAVIGALGYAFDQGSEAIFGIPAVPPPWCRLRGSTETDPGRMALDPARNDRLDIKV